MNVKTNQITGASSTGNQTVTDPGFEPKLVLLLSGLQTALGASAAAHFSIGAASSTITERSAGYNAADNSASSDVSRFANVLNIIRTHTAGTTTINTSAVLQSLNSDGFTLNWGNLTTTNPILHYLTLGGDDIEIETGNFDTGTTTGEITEGTGFEPDLVILFATLQETSSVSNNHNQFSFGVFDKGGNQWAMGQKSQHNQATTNTSRYFDNTACLIFPNIADNNIYHRITGMEMLESGFKVNVATASGVDFIVNYIAIKGGYWKVGTDTQKTSTGTKSITGLPFIPKGVIFGSVNDTQLNGSADHSRMMLGISDGTRNVSLWAGDRDNSADSIANTIMKNDKCIVMATEGTSATPTVHAEASVSAFNENGSIDIDWSSADSTERLFGYIAFGDTLATSSGGLLKYKSSGSFAEKSVKIKSSGSFAEKPKKYKNGGIFVLS